MSEDTGQYTQEQMAEQQLQSILDLADGARRLIDERDVLRAELATVRRKALTDAANDLEGHDTWTMAAAVGWLRALAKQEVSDD